MLEFTACWDSQYVGIHSMSGFTACWDSHLFVVALSGPTRAFVVCPPLQGYFCALPLANLMVATTSLQRRLLLLLTGVRRTLTLRFCLPDSLTADVLRSANGSVATVRRTYAYIKVRCPMHL